MKQVSTCATALRASDFAEASLPLFCCPRKTGRAIAARMPMMTITTSSSMSVKPDSSRPRARGTVVSRMGMVVGNVDEAGKVPASSQCVR